MRRLVSCVVAMMLLVGSVIGLSSCGRNAPPDIEDIYDRLVEVVEASHEVNVVLFGAGLPVYERGSAEDELLHRYYGMSEDGREFVSAYAKYLSMEEIEAAVSEVYGSEYRESMFETLFTGYALSGVKDSVLPARYAEDASWMYQNEHVKPLVVGTRVYDYSTMKIVSPSSATHIRVEVQSYAEDRPGEWRTVDLSFVYENGNWYLDGPSC